MFTLGSTKRKQLMWDSMLVTFQPNVDPKKPVVYLEQEILDFTPVTRELRKSTIMDRLLVELLEFIDDFEDVCIEHDVYLYEYIMLTKGEIPLITVKMLKKPNGRAIGLDIESYRKKKELMKTEAENSVIGCVGLIVVVLAAFICAFVLKK